MPHDCTHYPENYDVLSTGQFTRASHFDSMDSSAVLLFLGTSVVNKLVKGIFLMELRVFPIPSPSLPTISKLTVSSNSIASFQTDLDVENNANNHLRKNHIISFFKIAK